jgi:methyl-accepting chemotaxis protein
MHVISNILKNVKVAVRLPAVIGLALVALIVFALTALTTLSSVRIGGDREIVLAEQNQFVADLVPPAIFLLEAKIGALDLQLAVADEDTADIEFAMEEIDHSIERFHEQIAHWESELTDPDQVEFLATVKRTGSAYIDTLTTTVVPAAEARDHAALDAAEITLEEQFATHRTAVLAATDHAVANAAAMTADADELAASRQSMLWVLLIVTLIVVGAAAVVVTRSVLKPLDELRSNMDEIASGDGSNAGARLDADRRDEFGMVAESFNTFADKLVAYSQTVADNAVVAERRADEVTAAATVASENMNTVAVATTELSAAASEIARSAGDASRTAETAVRAADHANQLMERLADSSARIGEVVESIRGIAGQTTMLALNATIEAARAGEAGRGFAVVASEVKDLAAETGTATADIVGRVEAIQADTQAALMALSEVGQVITEISSSQSVIAAAVEEQAATTAEIDRSLTEAVTAVNQLATRTGAPSNHHFTTAA